MENTPQQPEETAGQEQPQANPTENETPAKRRALNYQDAISLGVFLLGFLALFVSIRQASIMNRQTEVLIQQGKAGAWPILEIGLYRGFDSTGHIIQYGITVANKGVGPAIVNGVQVAFDDKPAQHWSALMQQAGAPDSIPISYSNSLISNRVISAGEEVLLLDLSDNPRLMRWFFRQANALQVSICYRSLFDDQWVATRKGFKENLERPVFRQVQACPFVEGEQFLE
jgi:hypothetical protein